MIAWLDRFGRRSLAWPATLLGACLTIWGGLLLRFAAWMLDIDPREWELDED